MNVADYRDCRTPACSLERGLSGLRPITQVTSQQLEHRWVSHHDHGQAVLSHRTITAPQDPGTAGPTSGAFRLFWLTVSLCVLQTATGVLGRGYTGPKQ